MNSGGYPTRGRTTQATDRDASSDVNGGRSRHKYKKPPPKDGQCMTVFGVGADVQQTRVIAVVMITVPPEPANSVENTRSYKNSRGQGTRTP